MRYWRRFFRFERQNAGFLAQLQPAYGWLIGIWYTYRVYIRLILRRENAHIPGIPVDIALGAVPSTRDTVQYILTIWLIFAVNIGAIVPGSYIRKLRSLGYGIGTVSAIPSSSSLLRSGPGTAFQIFHCPGKLRVAHTSIM